MAVKQAEVEKGPRKGMRRMKKITAVAIWLALLLIVGSTLTAQENRGPKITVDEARYDLGKVVQGTQATHTFEVRNTGNEPLVIDHVQPS